MAESIVVFLAERVEKLLSLALQEAALAWGVEDELRKFQNTLNTVRAVILDAEQRQSREHGLRIWIDKLTDVLYDFENIIDEFECEALRKQVVKQGNKRGKVRYFFSHSNPIAVRIKIGRKIKEIKQGLDEITAEKDAFNLNQSRVETTSSNPRRLAREPTHSFTLVSDVIGRDKDRDEIVGRLVRSKSDKGPFIISIVGLGGLGKTTLAKLVYNDETIKDHFELRMWVCVSEDFDLKQLMVKMIKSVSMHKRVKSATWQNSNLDVEQLDVDQLQEYLRHLLKDKKFLLILDDVWDDNRNKWRKFVELLAECAKGSSIVVTTRDTKVAYAAGTAYNHKLKGLSHDYCMSLFRKSFEYEQEAPRAELFEIASDIISKCGGVPLVVKSLGSLLCLNTDEKYWKFVRDNDMWRSLQIQNDILPIIQLSYDNLPPHLKRCFNYCSLFPPDFVFDNINLRHIWLANGLIDSSDEKYELEDVADQYIKDLLSRSLFEELEEYGTFFTFTMHDIVHKFAVTVAKSEFSVVDFGTKNISPRVRHISFSTSNTWEGQRQLNASIPEFLTRLDTLQTLLFQSAEVGPVQTSFVKACIDECNYLRVLDLRGSDFGSLPRSIYKLKHLRYLDLLGNCKVRTLPDSICMLQICSI